jgi:CheY-like chemotaxis protein/anti-sigma regulatory factor (Ser/Thr protein kinase)
MAWNEIRHRARLVVEYGDTGLVEGSDSRLGQVFLNLMVNAAQAIPEGDADGHVIRIASRKELSGRVVVEITDSGSGIAPENLRHLFTPFYTTKEPGVGTGLGLAICHRIVTGLGGELLVRSELGKGTTFTVILQAAPDGRPVSQAAPPPIPRALVRGRVLVIDDDPMVGTVVARTLAKEHEVVATVSARDGLARLRAGEVYDVIICDLMMPQMTGAELYAELLKFEPRLAERMIFLTGGAFTTAARTFLDDVNNAKLEKPFDARELRALVNERVGRGLSRTAA